ncbi:apoptotic chromatin condensation inducer in the nucleus isoform X1 [Amborella trichopoda]|uniref:SAP domain-containing protein n=1 Tax=Amborella trichopoda TaxID=13333 RepID=W1NFM1_AMBTC|nr:apoptotic chromatin condensation inducer in the nucleus isoform X1 [Amborella trichopoda]ERM94248.1 hypothetical protein AMTR_s00010p00217580 [Amborella trichopoda]|eukprot:XP_006827011.1 apoptotic chromatin condensation inducer in the nucleus isoform X1 [Amborella trichopoda]
MPSKYPVLGNRPLEQWKVTELKDELRKRNMITKGLKEDLLKRLSEAILNDENCVQENVGDGLDTEVIPQVQQNDELTDLGNAPVYRPGENEAKKNTTESIIDDTETKDKDATMVDNDNSNAIPNQGVEAQDCELTDSMKIETSEFMVTFPTGSPEVSISVSHSPVKQIESVEKQSSHESLKEDEASKSPDKSEEPNLVNLIGSMDKQCKHEPVIEDEASRCPIKSEEPNLCNPNSQVSVKGPYKSEEPNLVNQIESIDKQCKHEPVIEDEAFWSPIKSEEPNPFNPNSQVSGKVSPISGVLLKCDSVSSDSVSINENEKNELKDNLNADNLHLELEASNPEGAYQSSTEVPPVGGSLDGQEPGVYQSSMEIDEALAASTHADLIKKVDSADGGSSEKLNLDRSSGDESLEDDGLESKQSDVIQNTVEVRDKDEVSKLCPIKEDIAAVAAVADSSPNEKNVIVDRSNDSVNIGEKRKIEGDQEAPRVKDPSKRQCRWNSEPLRVSESQNSLRSAPPLSNSFSVPRDRFSSLPKTTLTNPDSPNNGGAPKERIVPPSEKPATTSLRIDQFLRPFTLKAVQELLAKTGTVSKFWMDHIKTHCYVTYSSEDEAMATRNALYNLQWPSNGGRCLTAEFVDPEEVKVKLEAPLSSPATTTPNSNKQNSRQQPPNNATPLPSQPSLSKQPPLARETLAPPPPPSKKPAPPILTLDDLFMKTRASPRIYFLPLSEEQVAAKLAARERRRRV